MGGGLKVCIEKKVVNCGTQLLYHSHNSKGVKLYNISTDS